MGTKYDYISLKNQYVQGTMSIRELCRINGIRTWSTVNAKANADHWDQLRAEFQRQLDSRSIEAVSQKRANKIAEIGADALEVIHAAILKSAADMDAREPVMDGDKVLRDKDGEIVWRPVMRFGPNQFETIIKQLLAMTGQPTTVTENRNLNLGISAEASHDELRAILAALRPRQPAGGAEVPATTGNPPGPRTN